MDYTDRQIKQLGVDGNSKLLSREPILKPSSWRMDGDQLHAYWEYPIDGMELSYFGMDFCPSRSELAFCGRDATKTNQVTILSSETGEKKHTIALPEFVGEVGAGLCYSDDGRRLAGSFGKTLMLWDAETCTPTVHEPCSTTIHSLGFFSRWTLSRHRRRGPAAPCLGHADQSVQDRVRSSSSRRDSFHLLFGTDCT